MDTHAKPELALEIIVDIISRLPVKLIVGCKLLSKAFKNLISDPSFSRKSNSLCTIFVGSYKPAYSFDLVELDATYICNKEVAIFESDRLLGRGKIRDQNWNYCNGLFCFIKYCLGSGKIYITNPIIGEFIQLPEPVYPNDRSTTSLEFCFCHGLGYCQLTNKYKVLRIMTKSYRRVYNHRTEIFTIGSDQNWRIISDSNVKGMFHGYQNSSSITVPFRSALHWIMYHYPVSQTDHGPGEIYLCAFDMTEEKARALPLPPEVVAGTTFPCLLSVLLDKICAWQRLQDVVNLWVMDDYGVEGSWTKQFVLKLGSLKTTRFGPWRPLVVSPGVIMVNVHSDLLFYDMKKKEWSSVIRLKQLYSYPIPFVPSFVSLRNLAPGLMLDVYP